MEEFSEVLVALGTPVCTALAKRAYDHLKTLVEARLGSRARVALADPRPDDPDWLAQMGNHLAEAGLADDAEVLAAARQVLAARHATEVHGGATYGQSGGNSFSGSINFPGGITNSPVFVMPQATVAAPFPFPPAGS